MKILIQGIFIVHSFILRDKHIKNSLFSGKQYKIVFDFNYYMLT